MTNPLIGLTVSRLTEKEITPINQNDPPKLTLSEAYTLSIIRAGGTPVLLPFGLAQEDLADLAGHLQGIVFTGGGDIDPAVFNGKPHARVNYVDRERDALELSLAKRALQLDLPLLFICRGIQLLNVALGGTLYTDLHDHFSDQIKHDCYNVHPRDYIAHTVRLEPGSLTASALGKTEVEVNSLHHQGLEHIGDGLVTVGYAPDGLVEAVEIPEHRFCVGVQWHPESLPDSPPMQSLFRAFVQTCSS